MNALSRNVFRVILVVLTLAASAVESHAQWTYFDNNADIRALCERGDSLWIGTNGGVLIFDLLGDRVVDKIVAGDFLPGNSVRVIRQILGRLNIGTDDGLVVVGEGSKRFFTPSEDPRWADIRSVDVSRDSTIYVSTFGHGVAKIEHDDIQWITHADSLLDDKVYAVAGLDSGSAYFATSLGLCAYRDSAWVGFQAGAGLPRGEVKDLIRVTDNRFIVLIEGRGIFVFDGKKSRRVRLGETFAEDDVAAITVDSTNTLWAAGRYGGIARYRGGRWERKDNEDPTIGRTRWRCAYTAPDGTVLFGSADGVIAAVGTNGARTIRIPSVLPSGYVGAIVQGAGAVKYVVNGSLLLAVDQEQSQFRVEGDVGSVLSIASSETGDVWAATPWGLLRLEGDRWTPIEPTIDPRAPLFVAVAIDHRRGLWAGAQDGEVYRFDGDMWVQYAERGELSPDGIHRIVVDGRDRPWVVSRSGAIHRYEAYAWKPAPLPVSGPIEIVDATAAPNGAPVVLTASTAWIFDESTGWRALETPGSRQVGDYRTIYFDGSGRLYLGTSEGLVVIVQGVPRWFGARGGLRGKEVASLLVDRAGYLWIGFRADGISRILVETLLQ